ncbi:hypothetical protein HO173_004989 [Letharia columbiana]|uniref:Cell cycle control protein n=1 Tax=Letharia columbiana TaxID=112416 RepID=A0A8H6FXU2_9LECA|nr:uncharacterized protein HO173_004989 [Letharia columbiana]KAF6236698.1 hypothetical protein HO173_004989 [Letharia columbiana]
MLSKNHSHVTMALEDFEKLLAEGKNEEEKIKSSHGYEGSRKHHRHHRKHHGDGEDHRRHKRTKRSTSRDDNNRAHGNRKISLGFRGERTNRGASQGEGETEDPATWGPAKNDGHIPTSDSIGETKRDSWMEQPSASDIDYTQKGVRGPFEPITSRPSKADFELKIHENELNKHHLQYLADGRDISEDFIEKPAQHEVDYVFGDAGAHWRMSKLNRVYKQAEETGKPVDEMAEKQYGDLRTFDDAREEQIELDRRDTYGEGYVGKEKPSGELFEERKLDTGLRNKGSGPEHDEPDVQELSREIDAEKPLATTVPLDQTALNRLKAQMLKAKVRGSSNAAILEAEYNNSMAAFAKSKQPDTVILGAMHNRMLTGSREGEVNRIDNKRGRERGLVEENEDMSIEDMVRQERRLRNQAGGDGQRFAERIAKDAKFDNDLDYMDENANKLAKRVQRSEINLKNTAISDFQMMNRILDNCPLCHHEDTNTPPVAPIVSLATRVYLTLPTEPEISEGGACIIPVQHRGNLLECDDDEWEEIRNFMKSLTRMYHDHGRDVIFYENAAVPQRKKHAGMEVVPLPYSLGETAPAFFKEAILTSDEEWTQHKKIIDTLFKAKQGQGKTAFRRTLAKEMPYFHVWFEIDGGIGHIVEDANRWPKGDLFAREIIGGMLDVAPDIVKRQGRWNRGGDRRVEGFRKRWEKFDWTRVLTVS